MARPVQGQAPPWGTDLNIWLDVGHNTDGSTKTAIGDLVGWAAVSGVNTSVAPATPTLLEWFAGGVDSGDPTAVGLDFSDPTQPVIPVSGIWAVTVWVIHKEQNYSPAWSDGKVGYAELLVTGPSPGSVMYWDTGATWPLAAIAGLPLPSASLTMHPTYVEAGSKINVKVSHNLDGADTFFLSEDWVAKLFELT